MAQERVALAPAKVNLGLRVVGRRPDGYHEIESLFAPLDLADELTVETSADAAGRVTLSLEPADSGVPADPTNLAVRAAGAFLEATGIAARIHIHLVKRTPAGAGLGGGSSDAGTVLRELSSAFPGALGEDELERLALELGADVPFFLDPRPALVRGVGERRTPIKGMPPLGLLLANPGEALATAEVYRAFDALHPNGAARAPDSGPVPPTDLREALARGELGGALHNDLEDAALRLCPAIRRLRGRLETLGALAVGMSGSGATLFGVYPDRESARAALEGAAWAPPGWARVASTRESG